MATNNKVFFVAYGNKSKSREIELEASRSDDPQRKPFRQGQTDEFKVNIGRDLGDLYKIRIGHSDDDRQTGWFVEKVRAIAPLSNSEQLINIDAQ